MLAKPQPDPNAVFAPIPILGLGCQDFTRKGQSSANTQNTNQRRSAAAPEGNCREVALLGSGVPKHNETNTIAISKSKSGYFGKRSERKTIVS